MNKLNLEEEILCDYVVTKQMKLVWQYQLEMVEEVDRICKKYNIKYFLDGGTLIGAVRHKGYIPWDDDIDIAMLRSDYDRFLDVAEKELEEKYFMQSYRTEKKYNRGHAQIRNSNTTAIINGDIYNKFNKGIFIDIFPLDNVPDDEIEYKKFIAQVKKKKRFLDNYYNLDSGSIIKKIIKRILHYIIYTFVDYDKEVKQYEMLVSKYKIKNTKKVGTISFSTELPLYKKEMYDGVVYMDFEYMKLACPIQYHELLTVKYGDYLKIPENKGGSMHGKVFFDTNKSYKEYEKKEEFEKVKRYLK